MITGIDSILIGSEDAKRLAEFYKDIVGLELISETQIGGIDDEMFEFKASEKSPSIIILDHSRIRGLSENPDRVILNLQVDNIDTEADRLSRAGVKKVQDVYRVEDYGRIATFSDPDGNFFQLVQTRS